MTKPTPYYRVNRKGRAYWCAGRLMRAMGFRTMALGPDSDEARRIAQRLTEQWREARKAGRVRGKPVDLDAADRGGQWVYFLQVDNRIKIGVSVKPFTRARDLAGASHGAMTMVLIVRGTRDDEYRLHKEFGRSRTNGEWFVVTPKLKAFVARCARAGEVIRSPKSEHPAARVESPAKTESNQGELSA